ncbi:MAG TPA: tRNA (N6-isopentenyl adenosine(37)-C2)-methylthiotransferase MiaB [Candidatus Polarisedimenticolia bacterium]|nr:tRNA (N6-isopentenyl adenosine(37)-C2)-methylthiotransferase MiaB [Candidatus Polarisedimenticolia bacterium]
MRRYLIETWGCQMNAHDSEKLAGLLTPLGYEPTSDASLADLILLNTCTVREKAAEKVFSRLGELRPLKETNPDLLIGVCGCLGQQEGEAIFRRAPYVDLVMGPRTIARLGSVLEAARRDGRSISLARDDEPLVFPSATIARAAGPRAYVTVMEGCNKACTYCIVPYTRGREAYRAPEQIVAEARSLAEHGYCEIELLGQNVNAYHHGVDTLASLLWMVDRLPGVRRVRFTTSHPGHLKRPIIEAMRDVPSVCNHLHLPVQSGSDSVLRAMNRGYTRARYLEIIDDLRRARPDIALSTDVIVGFPGESHVDFEATLALLREVQFDQVYAFAFSPRPGTPAAEIAGAPRQEESRTRLVTLLQMQEEIQERLNRSLIGRTFEVLLDGPSRRDDGVVKGRTSCNRIVHVPQAAPDANGFLRVRITRAHAHSLTGQPLAHADVA